MAVLPAAVALPVLTLPRAKPHAVAPVVRTIAITATAPQSAVRSAVPEAAAALPETATARFDLVGARWRPGTLAAADQIQVRVRTAGAWSTWNVLERADYAPDKGTADDHLAARAQVTATEPLWVRHADGVQARVIHADGTPSPGPRDLTLVLVDPGSSGADDGVGVATPLGGSVATAAVSQPAIYTRAQWGADESLRTNSCPEGPDYSRTIKVGFVHHTDTQNGYSTSEVPSMIRSIYAYHVQGNGWCDIGYNFLIDRFGRTWEGRYGGITKAVIGAHTGGFNKDSFGVAALGTYTSATPPAGMLTAYERLFGWKLGMNFRDPTSTNTLVSAGGGTDKWPTGATVRFNVISGHRDAGSTSCPGNALYSRLGTIRSQTRSLMGAGFIGPGVQANDDSALGGSNFMLRATPLDLVAWTLTVRNKANGNVVKTVSGTASPPLPVATGWDRRDANEKPVAPGTYTMTLTGSRGSSSAYPFVRDVTVTKTPPPHAPSDVTGDGYSDLVVGEPGEQVGSHLGAGSFIVQPGSLSGIAGSGGRFMSQDRPAVSGTSQTGGAFASALATGDFNGDGFADVAVGIPGLTIGSATSAGSVNVFWGGPDGPRNYDVAGISQATPGIDDVPETGDRFGATVAAGDVNGDGIDDLVIGAPGESVGSATSAGLVTIVPGSATGLAMTQSTTITQNTTGLSSVAEPGDTFGTSLAASDVTGDAFADIVVGSPGETTGASSTGAVTLLRGSAAGILGAGASTVTGSAVSNAPHFGQSVAVGAFNGTAQAVAVGGDSGVTALSAGAGGITASGAQTWTQDSPGVPGSEEAGDTFGAALAAVDTNQDGADDLVIGNPTKSIGSASQAGSVTVLFGSASGLTTTGAQYYTQSTPGLNNTNESGDRFGAALGGGLVNSGSYGDVIVGSPGEGVGSAAAAGLVIVLYGGSAGPSASTIQGALSSTGGTTAVPQGGARYGSALG
jgi:hypothetical protein